KLAQIREILISESTWEEMTCLFAPSLNPGAREELNAASSIWLTKAQYQYLLRMENTLQPESRISLLLELVSNAEHHGFMERLVNIP
ncbi:hypothetical protein LXO52_24775, partial [Escherichia coli]|nr:hypothetical protein [Escherichia coli]